MNKSSVKKTLSLEDKFTVFYHALFSFPLKKDELNKWKPGNYFVFNFKKEPTLFYRDGFYFLKGRSKDIYKRLKREKYSLKKNKIAQKAVRVLSFIPFIKMVGITGSLAMANTDLDSDIDFFIITQKGTLWTSRLLSIFILKLCGFSLRRSFDKYAKDKICLNMWFDESNLVWEKRSLFSAHEIAQIIPVLNKDGTYEKFIMDNRWIFKFWPNSVSIKRLNSKRNKNILFLLFVFLISVLVEPLSYLLQRLYMKNKVTREIISPTRAVFHPVDLESVILKKLREKGLEILSEKTS